MSRVVILGSGVSGHTAAAFARRWLERGDEVVVVSPNANYNWLPSNVWVGAGLMRASQVCFALSPVYKRAGIHFVQARATEIHPRGQGSDSAPFVMTESTVAGKEGARKQVFYDWLIDATGPHLDFESTPGLGPGGNSLSVCTAAHAERASEAFAFALERMRRGERQRFVVGAGHGECTCLGAAFEYLMNIEFELRTRGLRDRAEITWLSNEFELGDLGLGGAHLRQRGTLTTSRQVTEALFTERGIRWITGAHVRRVDRNRIHYTTLADEERELAFDFAMLLPAFSGVRLKVFERGGADITSTVFRPDGFMLVDADYTPRPFAQWSARDWPRTYRSPALPNVFAAGIAFAPPHAIAEPRRSPRGVAISPAAPRTGMPSAMIGKAVARNVVDLAYGADQPRQTASMAELGSACLASAGANPFTGMAATMTVFPVVPDFERYPEYGRDLSLCVSEVGLAGNWTKHLLHHLFLYKARMLPGWSLIPE